MNLTFWKECEKLNMTFRQYLEGKFLEWQQQMGGRRTVEEFADYLGVGRTTLSMWWNKKDRFPQDDNVRKLADKLGLEVYEVLGLESPDPDLHFIEKNWEHLPPDVQRSIREQAEKYATSNEAKRAPAKRRTSTP